MLLNDNLQKMVEFTTENVLVETPITESPITNAFSHHSTAVITSSHCPTSIKRKCKRFKRAGEYSNKKKYTPRTPPTRRQHSLNDWVLIRALFVGDWVTIQFMCKLLDNTMMWVAIIVHMQVSYHWGKTHWALIRVVILLKWATIIIHM
jgi:hypothetical protein